MTTAKSELMKAYTALLTPEKRKARAKSVINIDGKLMFTINSPAAIAATASGYIGYVSDDSLCGIVVTQYRPSYNKPYENNYTSTWSLFAKRAASSRSDDVTVAIYISDIRNGDRIFFFTRPNVSEPFKLTDIPSKAELVRILGLSLVEQVPPRFGILSSKQP